MPVDPPAPLRRLRIAVLNRVFAPIGGGAERYSIALVEQLAQRHEVHVFAQTLGHAIPGVTGHRISAPLLKPRWINQLWYAAATWWATRRGFDIVHSHENGWHGDIQTVHVLPVRHNLFYQRSGWRLGLRWAKVLTSPRLLVYLWLERVRFVARPRRRVVVISDSLKAVMAQVYPATVDRTDLLPPGVEAVPGRAAAAERATARLALGLPVFGRCLLFVGNDYRKKGLDALLRALAELPVDTLLAVVGNTRLRAEFDQQARVAGLADRVFFLGPLPDVAPAYRAADLLVHPTLEDTFAMVVLEAMAHGLPVVVSAVRYCGIAGLLRHGRDALVLEDPHDAKALAGLLAGLLGDAAMQARLGEAGTRFARRYLWPELARQQEAIYMLALRG